MESYTRTSGMPEGYSLAQWKQFIKDYTAIKKCADLGIKEKTITVNSESAYQFLLDENGELTIDKSVINWGAGNEMLKWIASLEEQAIGLYEYAEWEDCAEVLKLLKWISPANLIASQLIEALREADVLVKEVLEETEEVNVYSYQLMANYYASIKWYDKAISCLTKAIKVSEKPIKLLEERAQLREISGDIKGAVTDLKLAVNLYPVTSQLVKLIQLQIRVGSFEEAKKRIDKLPVEELSKIEILEINSMLMQVASR